MSVNRRGFTLIELLIVVAIIAILAAIAVPNFLEAQVRAKVSRVRADQRTMATGLEAYHVDQNWYPISKWTWIPEPCPVFDAVPDENPNECSTFGETVAMCLRRLTTPVAFLTSVNFGDPFGEVMWDFHTVGVNQTIFVGKTMVYNSFKNTKYPVLWDWYGRTSNELSVAGLSQSSAWEIMSPGPDNEAWEQWNTDLVPDNQGAGLRLYDGTNGTMSLGDIIRMGP